MELHIKIAGILMILLSSIHLVFPRYFKWKTDLASLTLVNRQMMYVHTFFIGIVVLFMGLLCFLQTYALLHTILGRYLLAGMAIFWLLRLVIQFFGYSPALWMGKRKETCIHILFILLWSYFSFIFFYSLLEQE